ncbi:response regulator [Algoriphagus aquimarinus]|uniref:Response regulator transcription factor n=1 Tax=Algoriphagus aquimarinus TaxID=237018 RepID=A0A5C7AR51_9BACT|nr:response regulator transcription factor [Algoriphagus aquimarinus]TXE11226.1 response regulator transcription factor [Algoriphagus aquimarinus]
MPPIRIVLLDDHHIVLEGLRFLLDQDPAFSVLASFTQPEKVIPFLQTHETDILLTDYSMSGMNGLELIKKVKANYPSVKCVLLSMHDEPAVVRDAMKSQISGFLFKNISKAELKNALQKINSGLVYISPEISTQLLNVRQNQLDISLTEREMDILELIIKEFSNKQIADTLQISERTVETHRKNVFRKTSTTNLVGLMKYVFENKLMS